MISDAAPPVLARVTRGGRTESVHRGRIAVCLPDGRMVASMGNPHGAVYLRSAAKPFQAFPLLEAGGAEAFALDDDEIALMCASHGGEPAHVRVARRILRKGDFRESDLACGPHEPMDPRSARALAARGARPTRVHNNCSGNHAGILLACRRLGFPAGGYERPEHPIAKRILAEVARATGVAGPDIGIAVDGCGLPVFSLPLSALARAYAGLAAAQAGSTGRVGMSERRVWRAMCARPRMVAGRGRFTTDLLAAGRGAWIGKEGADGVYAMAIRATRASPPIGVAFKIEDGGVRARDVVAIAILDQLQLLRGEKARSLAAHRRPVVRNTRGEAVGEIVADVALSDRRPALARPPKVSWDRG